MLRLVPAPPLKLAFCLACLRVHGEPVPCGYDASLPCRTCGKPKGFRCTGGPSDGERARNPDECLDCWFNRLGL